MMCNEFHFQIVSFPNSLFLQKKFNIMLLSRQQALELLHKYVKNDRMIFHSLASEAVLRAMAIRLGRDVEKWGIAGLLHDLDIEITGADPKVHGLEAARMLTEMDVDPDVVEAIRLHNEYAAGEPRTTEFHHALAAGETITGLILATSLVYPDKKISSVKPKSIVKRMKEKAFAASVKRENILECELIGIPLEEFAEMAINAMAEIQP
jgi:putative nucleotidyltransferase with HDIG domain